VGAPSPSSLPFFVFSFRLGFLLPFALEREVHVLKKFVIVFWDFWYGNGGPNPPRVLRNSSFQAVIFVLRVLQFFPFSFWATI